MSRPRSIPRDVARTSGKRLRLRALAAALVSGLVLLPWADRAGASAVVAGGNAFAGGGDYGAGRAAAVTIGVGAAVVAVAGLGIWWFFLRDDDDDPPAGLGGEAGPVDVSSGPRLGLACPPGADGNATLTCW